MMASGGHCWVCIDARVQGFLSPTFPRLPSGGIARGAQRPGPASAQTVQWASLCQSSPMNLWGKIRGPWDSEGRQQGQKLP